MDHLQELEEEEEEQQEELFGLIKAGDLEGLKMRLAYYMGKNCQSLSEVLASTRNDEGLTMFLAACEQGHLVIVEFLLQHGSRIDERSMSIFSVTGLHLASECGHLNVVDRLVELGASLNEKANYGWTPLHYACEKGHLDIVMYFLRHCHGLKEEPISFWDFWHSISNEILLAVLAYGFPKLASSLGRDARFIDEVKSMCPFQV